MTLKALRKPFLLYSCLGLLTVVAVYLATNTGLAVLLLAGVGLTLVVLSVGTTGPAGVGEAEHAGDAELVVQDAGVWSMTTNTPTSQILLFYGLGLLLWSLVVMYVFYDIAG